MIITQKEYGWYALFRAINMMALSFLEVKKIFYTYQIPSTERDLAKANDLLFFC